MLFSYFEKQQDTNKLQCYSIQSKPFKIIQHAVKELAGDLKPDTSRVGSTTYYSYDMDNLFKLPEPQYIPL